MQPIWKDYEVDLAQDLEGKDYVDYFVSVRGDYVYNGRAYKAPDGKGVIHINDIVADYLGHSALPTIMVMPKDTHLVDAKAIAYAMVGVAGAGGPAATEDFINIWDYSDEPIAEGALTGCISEEYVEGMPPVYSYIKKLGTKLNVHHSHDWGPQAKRVRCCNAVALYFINSRGGWDYLLCKGGARREDSVTRTTTERAYVGSREKFNTSNAVQVSWEVRTGRIKEGAGANMWQLVSSPDVWLWTPEDGLVPVVMKTDSVQALSYRSNGRKPVEYTLTVELSQKRQRR